MSVTGHNDIRDPDDFYATPRWCVEAILPHLGDLTGKRVLEPGCGDGAIVRALPSHAASIVGVEMHEGRAAKAAALGRGIIHQTDYLAWAAEQPAGSFDVAIGNPPFALAMDFVQATLRIAKTTAFLLRLPWLASQGRADWMRTHTPSVHVLPKRPEFVMSVKCVRVPGRREQKKPWTDDVPRCTYEVYLPMTAERPRACPLCASKVTIATSDATDYMWAVWSESAPRVVILDVAEDAA